MPLGPFVAQGTDVSYVLTGYPFATDTAAAAATWVPIKNTKDFTFTIAVGEADTKNLASIIQTALPTIPAISASFTTQFSGLDTTFQTLFGAVLAQTLINMRVRYIDGTIVYYGGFFTSHDTSGVEVESVPEVSLDMHVNYLLPPVYPTS
jgi:hypothetical protein